MVCYRGLYSLHEASFLHAVNLKSSHQSFGLADATAKISKHPEQVDGNLALLQMVRYHAAKPNVLPREKWPPQLGVQPYERPTRHDWRRRLTK